MSPELPILERRATGLRVSVIRTTPELERVRLAWSAMQNHPNADMDYYLLINQARENVARPHVIVVEEEDGQPRAMLIGRIERTRIDCRIGYMTLLRPAVHALTIIYGGVLGRIDGETATMLIDSLHEALRAGEADLVRVGGLDPDGELFALARQRPGLFCRDWVAAPTPHWIILLPETYARFMERFNAKQRSEMRRWGRLLEKEGGGPGTCRVFTAPEEMDELCGDVEAVARLTYQRGIGVGFVGDPEHRQRLALSARNGWLRAYVLYAAGRPCAFEIGLLYRGIFYLEYTGYDPGLGHCRVGTQVILKAIEDLCLAGVRHVDCGTGDAPYKQALGDRRGLECSVMMFAPTWRGVLINMARTATLLAERAVVSMTRRLRLEQRIKKTWRTLLRKKSAA